MVAVNSDTDLTGDSPFLLTASGQNATNYPAAFRAVLANGDSRVVMNAFGDLAVKTVTNVVGGLEASLHVAQLDNGRSAVLLSNFEGGLGGFSMDVFDQGGPEELGFFPADGTDGSAVITLGSVNGVQLNRGIRLSNARYVDANTTLTSSETLVYGDAGSGGIAITLPPRRESRRPNVLRIQDSRFG